jgi:hypothetical protein
MEAVCFQKINILNTISVDYYERGLITRMGAAAMFGPFTMRWPEMAKLEETG